MASEYQSKRNFKTTPEPASGKKIAHQKKLAFVVQKHAAGHLHYDFRLEVAGVLKSWAVPKGISLNPADKRLAIMVEDHPYEYLHFEGTIPPGNYGAGTVMVWDTGVYEPLDAKMELGDTKTMLEGLQKGDISFRLKGEKLHGLFSMIKMKNRENQWLLIKRKDDFVSLEDLTELDYSVLTRRTLQQIEDEVAPAKGPLTQSKKKSNGAIH